MHAHGVTHVEQRRGRRGWGLGQPKETGERTKVRSGDSTAVGFDNKQEFNPSS